MDTWPSYLMDINHHYYFVDWNAKTYKIISEIDFYKGSKYKKKNIEQLFKSENPQQGNDYLMLKYEGKLIPVDYKLVPLVLLFWKQGFITTGLNQPDKENLGFVTFEYHTKKKVGSLYLLQLLLDGFPTKTVSAMDKSFESVNKETKKLLKKGFLVIQLYENFISITIDDTILEKMYKHLGLEKNEEKLPGRVIFFEDFLQNNKLKKVSFDTRQSQSNVHLHSHLYWQ